MADRYGNYPTLGASAANWQSLPSDSWNDPRYRSRFTGLNASCWPDRSQHSDSYIPQPYPSDRLLGGAMCSWSNEPAAEVPMFFGECFGERSRYTDPAFAGPGYPRPAPRAAIIAERLWAGAAATPQAVLEAVGCNYWVVPPPPPPSPPPVPGSAFSPARGACRDADRRIPYARLDHKGPVPFAACRAKCMALGERCDAFDVDGPENCGAQGMCGWCGIWGNLSALDSTGEFLYYAGTGGRACQGVPAQGGGNTCYRRPPFCGSQ